jgi:hypothetical protein
LCIDLALIYIIKVIFQAKTSSYLERNREGVKDREGVRTKEGRAGRQKGIFKVKLGLGETEIRRNGEA